MDDQSYHYKQTPMHLAAERGSDKVVQVLCAAGADPNLRYADAMNVYRDGSTPMHLAASNKHTKVVKILLEAGANHMAQDTKGRTPLDIAVAKKCKPLIKMLEEGPSRSLGAGPSSSLAGKKKAAEEAEDPPKAKTAKGDGGDGDGGGASGSGKRFAPPSAAGRAHYEVSEDGRCAIGKGGDNPWTALGGVLAVGDAVALKMVSKEALGIVGVAPREKVWDNRYGLEGQQSIASVRGSVALSCMGNLKINAEQGPAGLREFGAGDVVELRRVGEYVPPHGTHCTHPMAPTVAAGTSTASRSTARWRWSTRRLAPRIRRPYTGARAHSLTTKNAPSSGRSSRCARSVEVVAADGDRMPPISPSVCLTPPNHAHTPAQRTRQAPTERPKSGE